MIKDNNYNRFKFDPSENELSNIFNHLERSNNLTNDNRCCYIFVYGKHTKSTFQEISTIEGLELIAVDFYGPKILKTLAFIMAGYSGLIKIKNANKMGEIMKKLTNLSMAGLFSINNSFEDRFIDYYFKNNYKTYNPEQFVTSDSSYFSLIIDGDNYETESGFLGIVEFGDNCPEELSDIFKNFGDYGYIGQRKL